MDFLYQSLGTARSIRIITVHPNSNRSIGGSDPLRCEIEQVSLDQNPQYEALSYEWGDSTVKKPIWITDRRFLVTANLHAALLRLRNRERARRIWIDAICINQDDIAERSRQVAMMADIYSSAFHVIVWLGEDLYLDAQASRKTIDALTNLGSGRLLDYRKGMVRGSGGEAGAEDNLLVTLRRELSIFNSPFSVDAKVWKDLRLLLDKSWFHRSWVLQEVALSRHKTTVQCNKHFFEFDTLYKACVSIEVFGLASPLACTANEDALIRYMGQIQDHIRRDPAHEQLKLSSLLSARRSCKATDPRDKVFALLGLANDAEAITPDYSRPCFDVYMDAAKHVLHTDRAIQLLSEVKEHDPTSELPSWVPNWSSNPKVCVLAAKNADGKRRYTASGLLEPQFEIARQDAKETLHVHGICIDKMSPNLGKVSRVEDPVTWIGLTDYTRGLWPKMVQSVFPNHCYKATGEPLQRAYHRVLSADLLVTSKRLDEEARKRFYAKTIDFIQASKSTSKHSLYPEAMERAKAFGFAALTEDYVQEPESYANTFTEHVSAEIAGIVNAEHAEMKSTMTRGRKIFVSRAGYLGLCPETTEPSDVICILFGADVPFVLRPLENGRYVLIGECYLDGFMDGQGVLRSGDPGRASENEDYKSASVQPPDGTASLNEPGGTADSIRQDSRVRSQVFIIE